MDKTEWASECVIFLDVLLDRRYLVLRLPLEKRHKAIMLLKTMIHKRKATVKELQELCGYLNFLCKAVFPGHPFVRRMYAKYSKVMKVPSINDTNCGKENTTAEFKLKPYHHVRLDKEFKTNCSVWLQFLDEDNKLNDIVNRPMIDLLAPELTSKEIFFYSDASASKNLGYGCVYNHMWIRGDWGVNFIEEMNPSIEYLELFALWAGMLTWDSLITDCRITVFCNNTAVV